MIQCSPQIMVPMICIFPSTSVHGCSLRKMEIIFLLLGCVGSQRETRNVGLGKADPHFIEEVSSGKEAGA